MVKVFPLNVAFSHPFLCQIYLRSSYHIEALGEAFQKIVPPLKPRKGFLSAKMVRVHGPSTQEAEVGGLKVRDHVGLRNEFQTSLGCRMRSYLLKTQGKQAREGNSPCLAATRGRRCSGTLHAFLLQ